jgi:alkanesulfonate monooxygenase SsuD/methylene tetrahydromethanopterin reductase-like flavin-dependent oxidoreductase (luciferase family)
VKIGLILLLANDPETNRKRSYDSIRAIAQQAERDGFDCLWLPDNFFERTPGESTRGWWECWTMLSALAEATKRVEIGTLILINAFRNPATLAKMATTLDEVSHGRLILGLGAGYPGYNESMYQAFGLPFEHQVDRLREALQILGPLLKEGHADFAGHYYHARNCEDVPRGPRPAGPPLLVGGIGPRMLKLSAQYADLWNTGYMGQPETMLQPLSKIEAACREIGRDPATLGITALVGLWFPDLQARRPRIFDHTLTGTVPELAAAMRGYADLGVQHLMFQCEPYVPTALQRLTEALQLYRSMEQPEERLTPPPGAEPTNTAGHIEAS